MRFFLEFSLTLSPTHDVLEGTFTAHPKGFGFFRPADGTPDVFLPPSEAKKALHGATLRVQAQPLDAQGRRSGRVVDVVSQPLPTLIGRLGDVRPDGSVLFMPLETQWPWVQVPKAGLGKAQSNDWVACALTQAPCGHKKAEGRVEAVLGPQLTPHHALSMVLHTHDLPGDFSVDVTAQAQAFSEPVMTSDRVDLRGLPLVTIDGPTSRDFDDAVWCQKQEDGGYRLIVAIADVAHYVTPGSALDAEAFRRGTSIYLPGQVIPMLPEALSNELCSLNPGKDRYAMVCDMRVSSSGAVSSSTFYPALMRSHARLTYDQVRDAVVDLAPEARQAVGEALASLDDALCLHRAMDGARSARGALEFDRVETDFRLDPATGSITAAETTVRHEAHRLIEEFMIAANVEAARFLAPGVLPALFRVHAPPTQERLDQLVRFLEPHGLSVPALEQLKPSDLKELVAQARRHPEGGAMEAAILRTQGQAAYEAVNQGHFGLALTAYAHFTSPIRRYPDLVVHRALRETLLGRVPEPEEAQAMAVVAAQCSELERRATAAEREVVDRYKCAWLADRVGETLEGTITGMMPVGAFVELSSSGASGLIPLSSLPGNAVAFDPVTRSIVGDAGVCWKIGDRVTVEVVRASMAERRVEFAWKAKSPVLGYTKGP